MKTVAPSKVVADSRCVLTWKMADGKRDVKALLAAKGYRDPDLKGDFVKTSGRAILRFSHRQEASLVAAKKWGLRCSGIRDASPRSDNFNREV